MYLERIAGQLPLTSIPVVLAPKHTQRGTKITRVLVLVNGCVEESPALRAAAELAHRTSAELVLLPVLAPDENSDDEFAPADLARQVATRGDLADTIVGASQQVHPDIMVMALRDFLERVPLACLDAAAVPMLLISNAAASMPSDGPFPLRGDNDGVTQFHEPSCCHGACHA